MSVTSNSVASSGKPVPVEMADPDNRRGRILRLAAVVSSLLLMVPLWSAGPLALDEHGSYWIIDSDLPGSSLQRSLNYAAIPPLSGWMQQISLTILGKSEFAFRIPSAFCAVMAVLVIFEVGRIAGGSLCGGLAALLLAWHCEAMDEVRIARCYGLVLLMSSLLLYATLSWLNSLNSVWRGIVWGVVAGGLLWTHYTSVFLVVFCGLALLVSCFARDLRSRPRPKGMLTGIGVGIALSLPLVPSVLRLQEWSEFLNFSPASPSLLSSFGSFWWAGLPAGMMVCLIVGRKTGSAFRFRRRELFLMAACSLLPIAILAFLAAGPSSSLANPRYRVAFAPAGVCMAALILTSLRDRRGAISGAAVLLVVSWGLSPLYPWQLGRLGQPTDTDWYHLNRYLAEHSVEGEPIFVQGGLAEAGLFSNYADDRLFMEYVACRVSRFYLEASHPRYALPIFWSPATRTSGFLRELIGGWQEPNRRFWVACATDTDLNRDSLPHVQQIAGDSGFSVIDQQTWPHAVLICYQRNVDSNSVIPELPGQSDTMRGQSGKDSE